MTNKIDQWTSGGYATPDEDPGHLALTSLRRFEASGRAGRREFLAALSALAAGAPLAAVAATPGPAQEMLDDDNGRRYLPQHSEKVMEPVNVHEIEAAAKRTLDHAHFVYISTGAEDDYTLRDNVKAYELTRLRQHVGIDVSKIDTSTEVLGVKLDYPIILDPTSKNTVVRLGDKLSAIGAHDANAFFGCVTGLDFVKELTAANKMPRWFISTLGQRNKQLTDRVVKAYVDAGVTWLGVTVDHPYTPNRDGDIRNKFMPYREGVLDPVTPNLTWQYLEWVKSATSLPVVVKGILNAEDAATAVKYGADGIIVSNHGGRAYDGAVPTLMALPECVEAVKGKIPVMIDGGIRRGPDVVKALALGAKAVLVGRPPAWAVAAFGSVGVQRVMELLAAEFGISMAIAGAPNVKAINRSMVELPWEVGQL
jgi:isopentenyl diphosphate isomerase/L-lactate dehydrogenase-like FMN-dependent dehydrogenase